MSFARSRQMILVIFLPILLLSMMVLAGCSSQATRAEQVEMPYVPPKPSPEQLKIDSLMSVNVTLKQRLVKAEQDNNTLNSRLSDIEARLREEIAKAAAPPPPPPLTISYEEGMKAFNEKNYDDAIKIFQGLLEGGVPEDQADNCRYWIGESYFGKKEYQEAVKNFEMVMEYKVSEKKGDALFMTGRGYELLGDKEKAKAAFEKVVKDYPTNNNVQKAKDHWGRL